MTVDTAIRALVILFACIGVAVTLGALAAWASAASFRRQVKPSAHADPPPEMMREIKRFYREWPIRSGHRPGPFEERR